MKHFDKFKDRLRSDNTVLPDELSWENMGDEILQKVSEDQPSAIPYRIKWKAFIAFALVSTLGLLSALYVKHYATENENQNLSKTLQTSILPNEIKSETLESGSTSLNDQSSLGTDSLDAEHNSKQPKEIAKKLEENDNNKSVNPYSASSEVTLNFNDNKQYEISKSSQIRTTQNSMQHSQELNRQEFDSSLLINSDTNGDVSTKNGNDKYEKKNLEIEKNQVPQIKPIFKNEHVGISDRAVEINAQSLREVQAIHQLPILKSNIQNINPELNGASMAFTPSAVIKPRKSNLWAIELSSGWNTWSYGQLSDDNTLFDNSFSEYGFSHQFNIERKVSNKFSVSTGLGMDYLYKRVQVEYIEYRTRELENVPLTLKVNAITGVAVDTIFGNAIVVDTAYITRKDYNQFRVINIPLILNYNVYRSSGWNVDVGVGPTVSLLNFYQGRYVDGEDLVSYDKSSDLFSTSPKLALNANLRLKRSFTFGVYVGLRIDLRTNFTSWANSEINTIQPRISSASILVGKHF